MRPATLLVGIALLISACAPPVTETNKATVRAMIEAINARDFAALDTLVAPAMVRHSAATPDLVVESRDQFTAFLRADLEAVPDATQEIHQLIAEDDLVAVRATYAGTQDGPFGPFPPSGRAFSLPFLAVLRLEDGRIVEMWVEWDNLNVLTQLGHFPPPGGAAPAP